jgi:hypothetical protein
MLNYNLRLFQRAFLSRILEGKTENKSLLSIFCFFVMVACTLSGCQPGRSFNNTGNSRFNQTSVPALQTPTVPTTLSQTNQNTESFLTKNPNSDCNNKYWPIVKGAIWTYNSKRMGQSSFSVTRQINDVVSRASRIEFTITTVSSVDGRSYDEHYYCENGGIFYSNGDIYLPPDNQFVPGATWAMSGGSHLKMFGFEKQSVPVGTFQAAIFGVVPGVSAVDYFVEGVGLISQEGDTSIQLVTFSIPASSNNKHLNLTIAPTQQLTTDSAATPQVTKNAANIINCNKYWPIAEDATWTYEITRSDGNESEQIMKITNVSGDNNNTTFDISGPGISITGESVAWSCKSGRIIDNINFIRLPRENELIANFNWENFGGKVWDNKVIGLTTITVKAGTFNVMQICYSLNWAPNGECGLEPSHYEYYAPGVGLVLITFGNSRQELVSYNV